jgi:hypothetical protein
LRLRRFCSPLNTATTVQQPHTLTREKTVVVLVWCCVGTLNLFFNFIFGCFWFLKKEQHSRSSSSSSTFRL